MYNYDIRITNGGTNVIKNVVLNPGTVCIICEYIPSGTDIQIIIDTNNFIFRSRR